jgi:adenylate cyclase
MPMTARNTEWDHQPIIDWLISEGRFSNDITAIARDLGQQLHEAGAPVWRFRLSMRTLHPLIAAVTGIWERDGAAAEHRAVTHGLEGRSAFIGSPMQRIGETQQPFRKRLAAALTDDDHNVLHDLKARGATDYFGCPLIYATGGGGIAIFTSDHPNGFSDHDVHGFERIVAVLQLVAEIYKKDQIAIAVAEAYLGPRTGRRVLEGQITRGHVETIRAAILVSDVRDWSRLSTRLPSDQMLGVVNRYFEIMAGAIEAHGGEIIKFIGDSVLAIFEVQDGQDEDDGAQVCARAVMAAQMALSNNERDDTVPLEFGIGLHFGDVLYGNIGAETRIDFTVLGQPVNIAVRIEGLCSRTAEPLLYSDEIARRLPASSRLVGTESLKGHDEAFEIFAPFPDA